ncbi:MAG: pectate lyase [Opitutaceae bacterium]|nr:pectate lyase [Opitutaceae bacterium]
MKFPLLRIAVWFCVGPGMISTAPLALARQVPPPIVVGKDGKLEYVRSPSGDAVPDYSHAGFKGGGVRFPDVFARVRVAPAPGDDGARIQAAIDYVSALPLDKRGVRGAVQLERGRYEIEGQIQVSASGVVLRGAGAGEHGTTLVATGRGRRTLIKVSGAGRGEKPEPAYSVADAYVPVGSSHIRIKAARGSAEKPGSHLGALARFEPGTRIVIERPSAKEWVHALGMDDSPARQPYSWQVEAFSIAWDRVVLGGSGDLLELDAPLTTAIDARLGGATVSIRAPGGMVENVGVENLRCISEVATDNPKDEDHAWNAIDIRSARDAWVCDVTAEQFSGMAVNVDATAMRITVQDCRALRPVSEDGGYRRMAFHSGGQQVLFLRCQSEHGRNDFTAGYLTAGPVVFLDCEARETRGFSGSIGSWSSGLLFDGVKVDGGALRLDNLETWNQGVGWNAANSMLWGCSASVVICRSPPGASNWAVGVWGQFVGDGAWGLVNEFPRPESLYRAQLSARLGAQAAECLLPRRYIVDEPMPAIEEAVPDLASRPAARAGPPGRPLSLVNGWLVSDGQLLKGNTLTGAWWLGRLEPARAGEFGPAITRFSPGRAGTGLTDDLAALADAMVAKGQVAWRHHYGLWYDRRRIDHQMIRRPDGDVYPPFFEQPFARSGQGVAWDGLSRYDLTRYNPWYFSRLRDFASEARARGLVLVNEMYFQHNILESGAHWVDSPWRPVNNINSTGFTEPPPFTGDTIRMAAEFYDVGNPTRRALHRAFIRQCLANLSEETNVIHTLTAENSGPLSFMQFWLDVVAEWENETGRHPLIALSAPKDVQDAILADGRRAALIDVIDLSYWFRDADGKLFAPDGGTRLAPRQHLRTWKGKRPSAVSVASMVAHYRQAFPGKAVISNLDAVDGWWFLGSGGSLPRLSSPIDPELNAAIVRMRSKGMGILGEQGVGYFVVAGEGGASVDLKEDGGKFRVRRVDAKTGAVSDTGEVVEAGRVARFPGSAGAPWLHWLAR